MYSREEKLQAIKLFIKYDYSPAAVIREFGYPSIPALKGWYRQYRDNGDDIPDENNHRRYTDVQKCAAVDHFFEHGQCLARTMRALGYPSQKLLSCWIEELEPGRRYKRISSSEISASVKEKAVVDLITRREPAKEIASELGVEGTALYNWKRELLDEEVPCKMPRKPDNISVEEHEEHAESLCRNIDRLELRRAILEGTVELLGKGLSVDPKMLTNKEKTILVESLRPTHKLGVLLKEAGLTKSSYLYQKRALNKPDKYADFARPHHGDLLRKR